MPRNKQKEPTHIMTDKGIEELPTPKIEEWKKELKDIIYKKHGIHLWGAWSEIEKTFKSLIRQTLQIQRQSIIAELRGKIKKMKIGESEGWDFFFGKTEQCCPGDDLSDVYNKALEDILKELK